MSSEVQYYEFRGRRYPRPDVNKQRWYAQPDDLIGGWCVCNVDKPPSEHDLTQYEVSVADFTNEESARRIADLHNRDLFARDLLDRDTP